MCFFLIEKNDFFLKNKKQIKMVVYYYDAAWGVKVPVNQLKERFGSDENFIEMLDDFDTLSITDYLAEKFSADCFHIPHDYVDQHILNCNKRVRKVSTSSDSDSSSDCDDDAKSDDKWFFIGKKVTHCNNDKVPYSTFGFISKKMSDDAYDETVKIIQSAEFKVDDIVYATISNDCNCCT